MTHLAILAAVLPFPLYYALGSNRPFLVFAYEVGFDALSIGIAALQIYRHRHSLKWSYWLVLALVCCLGLGDFLCLVPTSPDVHRCIKGYVAPAVYTVFYALVL